MGAVVTLPSALKEACKDSMTEVRCRFADGEWETLEGPAFLERLAGNTSGGVCVDWVRLASSGGSLECGDYEAPPDCTCAEGWNGPVWGDHARGCAWAEWAEARGGVC